MFSAVIFTNLPRLPEQENQYNNFMLQMSVLSGKAHNYRREEHLYLLLEVLGGSNDP